MTCAATKAMAFLSALQPALVPEMEKGRARIDSRGACLCCSHTGSAVLSTTRRSAKLECTPVISIPYSKMCIAVPM